MCDNFTELVDLYPTISELCGLEVPSRLQGKSLVKTFDDPTYSVRDVAFCVNYNTFLLRTKKWAYIQHAEDASKGGQLFDMDKDPKQFTNLSKNPEYKELVKKFQARLANKLKEVRDNDIENGLIKKKPRGKKK